MDPSTTLADFENLRRLGEGSTGVVYQAEHPRLAGPVRLKVFYTERAGQALLARLPELGARLAGLGRPELPQLLQSGALPDGRVYVATPLFAGEQQILWAKWARWADLLSALHKLADLLAAAHARGLLHLSLRPSKVFLASSGNGEPRIGLHDLGLLQCLDKPPRPQRLPRPSQPYLAPEQRWSLTKNVDGAADVFALSALAGELLRKVAERKPPLPALPGSLEADLRTLFLRMRQDDPQQRPTMAAVAAELLRMRDDATAAAPGSSPARGAPPEVRQGLEARSAATPTSLLGSYRLLEQIGKGNFGTVYRAEHVEMGGLFAIKILSSQWANTEYANRFLREARVLNSIEHDHLVRIHYFGRTPEGLPYIVMEYLDGKTLESYLEEHPQGLPPREALQIAADVASALSTVHEKGIVHRDLSSRNIMFAKKKNSEKEVVKVLDFGMAKLSPRHADKPAGSGDLTERGVALGTEAYMAPEQFQDASVVDARADVYSLGVLLCEMLGGQRPFPGTAMVLFRQPPPQPSLPPVASRAMQALLSQMLRREQTQRPPMAEVGRRLQRQLQGSGRQVLTAAALLCSLLVIGLLAGLYVYRAPPPKPANVDKGLPQSSVLRAQAKELLLSAAKDSNPEIRAAAAQAMSFSSTNDFAMVLVGLLADPDRNVRMEAAQGIAVLEVHKAEPELLRMHSAETSAPLLIESAYALCRLGDEKGPAFLLELMNQGSEGTRFLAALRACQAQDNTGCQRLEQFVQSHEVPPLADLQRQAIESLARSGQKDTLDTLHQQLDDPSQPELRVLAAAVLGKLRGHDARAVDAQKLLETLAQGGDFRAAVTAAQLRNMAGLPTLLRHLTDPGEKLNLRVTAAKAIGSTTAVDEGLRSLYPIMTEQGAPLLRPLQLFAAAAILRLLISEGDLDAAEGASLDGSGSAASLLAWLDGQHPLPPGQEVAMFQGLGAKQRLLVTLLASQQKSARALELVPTMLEDRDLEVRIEGQKALRELLSTLKGNARLFANPAFLSQVKRMELSANLTEQSVAASVRAWLGDSSTAETLRRLAQQRGNVRVRELIVDLLPPSEKSPVLLSALRDPELSVRFLAARSLAAAGSRDGVPVLEEALKSGGGYALLAYVTMKRLGLVPAHMDWLRILSAENNLLIRYDAVGALVDLPVDEALPLLRFCLSDPAAVIRLRVGDVAAALYRQNGRQELLGILKALLLDNEASVRGHVIKLLRALTQKPGQSPAAPAPQESPPDLGISQADLATAAKAPVLKPKVTTPASPLSPREQRAQLLRQSAFAAERRNDFLEARKNWEALAQSSDGLDKEAALGLSRVQKELGSFLLYHRKNSQCLPEPAPRWGKPGENKIPEYNLTIVLYKGQHKDVKLLCNQP